MHTNTHKTCWVAVQVHTCTYGYMYFALTQTPTLGGCVCVCLVGNSKPSFPWVPGADRTSSAGGSYLRTSRTRRGRRRIFHQSIAGMLSQHARTKSAPVEKYVQKCKWLAPKCVQYFMQLRCLWLLIDLINTRNRNSIHISLCRA